MITQIEQKLSSCNADHFANLCRLYLAYRYDIVNSTGFVLGKEKSKKGTPDNFIAFKDFYIFNEITTTDKTRLIPKLKQDIKHCFNQKDVPTEKIIKIILICNSKITVSIQEILNTYKNAINSSVELEIIGIDAFSTIIFKEYPSIARELGINIDTGQILGISDFVSQYEKSKFSTPLSNHFFNRNEELKQAVSFLEKTDFLIISGQAGVGKTKFSLELAKNYTDKNPNYIVKYIRANGILDIWEDLKTQLIKDNSYLIVIDDANKLKSNLDLIINFKNSFITDNIKLIFTVRNYVKDEIQILLNNYNIIELKGFNKEELRSILQSPDFNITEFYSDKIYSISKGNPRIAIMAALAGINGEIEKLNNASLILEEYFSSVNHQLNVNGQLVKVAGILSLFRTIDFSHTKVIEEIEIYFNISKNILLENLELLNKYEIADEYNYSYKISDQILGEYIFYLVFIKQKQIPFSILLNLYINENKFSLMKLLIPIVSNYGFEEIKNLIIGDVITQWRNLTDINKCLNYLKDFWFFLPTESLMYINSLIPKEDTEFENFSFEIFKDNHLESYENNIFDILINFQQLPDKFVLSLEIIIKYGLSNQLQFSKLLKALTQSYEYGKYNYHSNHDIQIKLFDYLYSKIPQNELFFSKIILFIADKYLVESYESRNWDGDILYTSRRSIQLSEEHTKFRTTLWNFIFTSFENELLKDFVYAFFEKHKYEYHLKNDAIAKFDKEIIIIFFNNFLPHPNYRETKIVYTYLKKMDYYKIPYDNKLKNKFKNKEVDLWYLLSNRASEKKELILKYIKKFQIDDYKDLLQQINIISKYEMNHFMGYSTIKDSISHIFIELEKLNFQLFTKVLGLLFSYEYSNNLFIGMIFKEIEYDLSKTTTIRNLIIKNEIPNYCIVPFLSHIPIKFVTFQDYEIFMKFFRDEKINHISFIEDVFVKFSNLDINIEEEINSVINFLIKKSTSSNFFIHNDFFKFLYENHNNLFLNRLKEIEVLYLVLDEKNTHFDYMSEILKLILTHDPKFINDVLESNFEGKTYISKRDLLENDFKKLWDLENKNEIFEYIINFSSKFPMIFRNVPSEVSVVFQGSGIEGLNFLYYLVAKTNDERVLKLLFNIIVSQFTESKYDFLKIVLEKNSDIKFFRRLDFYAGESVTSGSRIPKIRQEITIYEELRNYIQSLNNLLYLEHVNFIENEINHYKVEIDWERKREFLSDWSI